MFGYIIGRAVLQLASEILFDLSTEPLDPRAATKYFNRETLRSARLPKSRWTLTTASPTRLLDRE